MQKSTRLAIAPIGYAPSSEMIGNPERQRLAGRKACATQIKPAQAVP